MLNIGLWGLAKADTFVSGISLVGGSGSMHIPAYYTEKEFWEVYVV
jgi:hypothetical protein